MDNPLTKKVKDNFNFEARKKILMNMPEDEFQKHFKVLLERMYPDDIIEITHGSNEYGKDIVRVQKDKISPQVYSYVIKMGDIKGNTAGNIKEIKEDVDFKLKGREKRRYDEIKDQIDQSLTHKARLQSLLGKLQVNHVYVVLVGNMTKNAGERLEKEVRETYKGIVGILPIAKIDKLFVEYYPEVFFDDKKIEQLQEIVNRVESLHYFGSRNMSLDDYFVPPKISHKNKSAKPLDELTIKEVIKSVKEVKSSYPHLFHLIKEKEKILLVGGRGTGKTTVLLKIVQDLVRKAISELLKDKDRRIEEVSVPLYVPARELLQEELTKDNIRENILGYPYNISVLLVDGLDEVPSDRVDEIISKAKSIAYSLGAGLIVASRHFKELDSITEATLKRYNLLDFELSQAINLVEKVLKKKTKNFSQVLEQIKIDLQKLEHQIPMFPLSLLMIIEILESSEHHELPASITEIYDRYMETILGKWDKEKKGLEFLFGYRVKSSFLEELAYKEFFKKNRTVIEREDYDRILKEYTSNHSEIYDVDKFHEEIMTSGILKERKNEIEFSHKSFLDYFIAKYLRNFSDDIPNIKDILAQAFLSGYWDDVTFFFIGLKGKLDRELLEKFIDYYKEDDRYHAWSLFRLGFLLQAGWQTESDIKRLALELSVEDGIPAVREEFISITKDISVPKSFADMFVFKASEEVYSTVFIKDVAIRYIRERLIPERKIYEATVLLNTLSMYFITEEEKKELENLILAIKDEIKELKNNYSLEKLFVSQAVLLLIAEKYIPRLERELKKDFKKFIKRYQESLLPYVSGRRKDDIRKKIK